MDSVELCLIIFIVFMLGVWLMLVVTRNRRENYKLLDDLKSQAGWIREKTPVPDDVKLTTNPEEVKLLSESVDPGANIECRRWCAENSKSKSDEFMTVCINTCIQEKWVYPDSKIKEFKSVMSVNDTTLIQE